MVTKMFTKDDLIFSYSRAQAIEDGVLVDVTETAKKAGFKCRVAATTAVWEKYVVVPDGVEGQDERGRLWDIVWMLRHAIKQSRELHFDLFVQNDNTRATLVKLKSVCVPSDDGSLCITIMLPRED